MSGLTSASNWTIQRLWLEMLYNYQMLFSCSYYEQASDSLLLKIFKIYWLFLVFVRSSACPNQTLASSLYLYMYTLGKGSVNSKNVGWKWSHFFEYWNSWPHVQRFRSRTSWLTALEQKLSPRWTRSFTNWKFAFEFFTQKTQVLFIWNQYIIEKKLLNFYITFCPRKMGL